MTVPIFAGFLSDMVQAARETNYPDHDERDRGNLFRKVVGAQYPDELVEYVKTQDASLFLTDITALVALTHGRSNTLPATPLTDALILFFLRTVQPIVHAFPSTFFGQTFEHRAIELQHIFPGKNALSDSLRQILSTSSYHTIITHLRKSLRVLGQSNEVLVQLPRELSSEERRTLSKSLRTTFPDQMITLLVERSLAGGIRFFANGVLHDGSWRARVQRILKGALTS
ncbi:MAG: hypothetical protein Q8P82_00345 [bacterium]|nr:hypothetical protein [bacterium]